MRPQRTDPRDLWWEAGAARPCGPADMLAFSDHWLRRMLADPAHAPAVNKLYEAELAKLMRGMDQDLQRMPCMKSRGDVQRYFQGMGADLARRAAAQGQPPFLLHCEFHGKTGGRWRFLESLRQAKDAGIGEVAIELPRRRSMRLLVDKLGGAALEWLGDEVVEAFLHEARTSAENEGDVNAGNLAGLVDMAHYCRDAKALGFKVSFVDAPSGVERLTDERDDYMARRLLKRADKGKGVMLVTGAMHGPGVMRRLLERGLPVEMPMFMSRGASAPTTASVLRHLANVGLAGHPNVHALALDDALIRAAPGARERWSRQWRPAKAQLQL